MARTVHFALHRLTPGPTDRVEPATQRPCPSAAAPGASKEVSPASAFQVDSAWIGALVPKRWAKRAVTRNLIKRQIYTMTPNNPLVLQVAAHVVRLRAGFGKAQYPSAASTALKAAVRQELDQLFALAPPLFAIQRPPAFDVVATRITAAR